MKKLGKFVPLVIILVTLGGCYASCGPVHFGSPSYTLTWNPEVSGFPNVDLTLTPIIPPKALSWKPSDYVQVDLTVGNFSFSTDNPDYQCLETVATTVLPIIFAPQREVVSGFTAMNDFLIVYHACGQFVQTTHANLASLGGIAENELIFFQITGQKMVSQAGNGQGLTPFGSVGGNTPTPTLPPPPTVLPSGPGGGNTPTPTLPPSPTVQILSPTAGVSYYIPPSSKVALALSSQASADVISYAWSDTLGLVSDSNANDTLTLTSTSTAQQLGCNTLLSDTITLIVTGNQGQTAKASVTIQINRECNK